MSGRPDPVQDPESIPWVTAAEMAEVDRIMVDEIGIALIQMMENAGRNLARFVLDSFSPRAVTVLAGSGGNGGGGLTAARRLHLVGVQVSVVLSHDPASLSPVTARQLSIIEALGIALVDEPPPADVAIDALVGYSLVAPLRGRVATLVDAVADLRDQGAMVVALDLPSGLDATTGEALGNVIEADATVTLALPKRGLGVSSAPGHLVLADSSVPPEVSLRFGTGAPDFSVSELVTIPDP